MMFDDRYEVILADTEHSKNIHYHLRYQVFCLEKKFENANRHGGRIEKDQYDDRAVHFLVRDRMRNKWIGATRLVIDRVDGLPINRIAAIETPAVTQKRVVAEFSRLLILDPFRQARADGPGIAEPILLLGLIRAAKDYCRERNIDQWVFLCRRAIQKTVGKVGIEMEQIGPACVHRGMRVPYRMDLATAFDGIAACSGAVQRMWSRAPSYTCYSDLCKSLAA
jgi:N-acyl amino acid synthase of PEP-CTERM/exosortase system